MLEAQRQRGLEDALLEMHSKGSSDGCKAVRLEARQHCIEEDAPAAPASTSPPAPADMRALLAALKCAFAGERAHGFVPGKDQPEESMARLRPAVEGLLKSYSSRNSGDWRQYALFSDLHYVRNLIELTEDFELLVLCWKGGQVSRVHNHGTSHCWLTVLGGEMREVQYHRRQHEAGAPSLQPHELPAGMRVDLIPTKTVDMQVGDLGYISDNICLHSVGCYTEAPDQQQQQQQAGGAPEGMGVGPAPLEGSVTLHLYSPPIRRVKLFEDGHVSDRVPGFFSIGGVRI